VPPRKPARRNHRGRDRNRGHHGWTL
jgi:hypothetical protein